MDECELYVAEVKIEDNKNDYIDLSNTTSMSRDHRRKHGVAGSSRASYLSTLLSEVLIVRPINPSEVVTITAVSEFLSTVDTTQLEEQKENAPPKELPPLSMTCFHDRSTEKVEEHVGQLDDLFSRLDSSVSSHSKSLLNVLKNVENGLDKDGKPTVEALTYLQANLHEELFKLIAKRGFDIRNCTLDELDELQRKLGFGWSVSEEDLDGDKDEVSLK